MNQAVETVINHGLTSQTTSAPEQITHTVNSLCEKLSDEGIHIEPKVLQKCLKKKKIVQNDGKLDEESFDMILNDFYQSTSDSQLEKNFQFLDTDNNGSIDKKEWMKQVKKLSKNGLYPMNISRSERKAMFEAADTDGDGEISIEEFMNMQFDMVNMPFNMVRKNRETEETKLESEPVTENPNFMPQKNSKIYVQVMF